MTMEIKINSEGSEILRVEANSYHEDGIGHVVELDIMFESDSGMIGDEVKIVIPVGSLALLQDSLKSCDHRTIFPFK